MGIVDLDLVFQALADPTWRAILDRLIAGEASVGSLAAPFALSQPTISTHLKVLETAGLVTRGRTANTRPVRLHPAAVDTWTRPYRALWDGRLARLETAATGRQGKDLQNGHDNT